MEMAEHKEGAKYASIGIIISSGKRKWFRSMTKYLKEWVDEHKDMRKDTWTPVIRQARDEHGVWK